MGSSEENEININDLVISEMAPSPSSAPINSFNASPIINNSTNVNLRKYGNDRRPIAGTNEHQSVPSMALSLLGGLDFEKSPHSLRDSPFFDPTFWKNDFEKRKEQRKRHFTMNLTKIDLMDYAVIDADNKYMEEMKKNKNKNR